MQIQSTIKKPQAQIKALEAPAAKTESAAPAAVDAIEKGSAEEKSLGDKLKHWFFHVDRNVPEGEKIKSSPYHKLTYGVVLGSLAWAAVDVATDIAAGGSPLAVAGKVAMNGAALTGGFLATTGPTSTPTPNLPIRPSRNSRSNPRDTTSSPASSATTGLRTGPTP